jgi:hypothetical protein
MNEDWDHETYQQQQCNAQENDQQLAIIARRLAVMTMFHRSLLSTAGSATGGNERGMKEAERKKPKSSGFVRWYKTVRNACLSVKINTRE